MILCYSSTHTIYWVTSCEPGTMIIGQRDTEIAVTAASWGCLLSRGPPGLSSVVSGILPHASHLLSKALLWARLPPSCPLKFILHSSSLRPLAPTLPGLQQFFLWHSLHLLPVGLSSSLPCHGHEAWAYVCLTHSFAWSNLRASVNIYGVNK